MILKEDGGHEEYNSIFQVRILRRSPLRSEGVDGQHGRPKLVLVV